MESDPMRGFFAPAVLALATAMRASAYTVYVSNERGN